MKLIISLFVGLFTLFIGYSQENTKVWSLQECIDYANQNNISIKRSELSSKIQEVEVTRNKMAFYPSVSGSIGGSFSFWAPNANNSFNNNYAISSGVTLYNGERNKNYLKVAKKNLKINELQVQEIKDDITLRVVNAYLNILYNRESVTIAKDQVAVGKELVNRMKELVEAGTKAHNDLYQIEANLATNEENLVKAENNLDLALLDLALLLQIPNKGFTVEDVQVTIEQARLLYSDSDIIYNKALNWRPEIERAKINIENSETNIAIAKAGILPNITASYSFGTNYLNFQNAVNQPGYLDQLKDNRGHSLGVSVTIPIFDKYATKTNVQKAVIQKEIASYSLEDERTNLRAEVERAYIDAKTSLKTFDAAKKSVEAQEEAYRTAKERYDLGILTSYDFDQVRNQLVNARSAFIRAKYNFIFRSKFLEFYYGIPIKL
jgi:outer membrane protein